MTTPEKTVADQLQHVFGAGKRIDIQAEQAERLRGGAAHVLLIIDQKNARVTHSAASLAAAAASSSMRKTAPPSG